MRNDIPFRRKARARDDAAPTPTDAERKLWRALRDRRSQTRQIPPTGAVGPYIVDFLCVSASTRRRSRWFAACAKALATAGATPGFAREGLRVRAILEPRGSDSAARACWRRSPRHAVCHGEAAHLPSSGRASRAPPSPASGRKGRMIRLAPPLRRAGDDDEFLVPARRLASGGDGRARRRARACRDRHRRPQHARRRGARACLRAREPRGARRVSRRHRARGSPSSTARPISSSIRRTAPLTGGSAGSSARATCARRRASAI